MATGRQSFEGSTTAVIFDGILNRQPPPPRTINASVPVELERIINKALEKDRMLRYQTAADMRADLQRLKRDSGTRHSVPVASDVSQPSVETVVLRVSPGPAAQTPPQGEHARSSNVLLIAAVSGGLVLFLAGLVSSGLLTRWLQQPAAPQTVSQQPAAPASQTPTPPPATQTAPPTAAAPATQPAPPPKQQAAAKTLPPPVTPPTETAPVAPPLGRGRGPEGIAAQRLDIAQAKIANNLLEPALGDLRQIVNEFPTTRAAAEASFLAASLLEKLGRVDDAMAAHIEFNKRYSADRRAADSKLRLAELTIKSRRPNREMASREMLNEVVRDHPKTPQAMMALQQKIRMESGRGARQLREKDPVLGIDVPVVLTSLRTFTEQFPMHPGSMNALNRLSEMYLDLNQPAFAAQALIDLGTRFPNNPFDSWFLLGELYERRMKDPARAKEAY